VLGLSTSMSRRAFIAGSAAGAAALAVSCDLQRLGGRPLTERMDEVMLRHFGRDIAASPAALAFVADFALRAPSIVAGLAGADLDAALEYQLVSSFLHSTTYLSHVARGEELFHFGVYDPYERPCSSQLAAPL